MSKWTAAEEMRISSVDADDAQRREEPEVRRTPWSRLDRFLPPLITGLATFFVFELIHRFEIVSPIIWPSSFDIAAEVWNQAFHSYMWSNLWATVQASLIGFCLGSIAGIAFGIAIALSRTLAAGFYPYLILLQSSPRISMVPLFIAIFGFGMTTKVVTAIILAFFPPVVSTIVGLREVDQDRITLMRSLKFSKPQVFRKLLWPSALPMIFGGLKVALTVAFLGAFVAELTAANDGIGLLLELAAFELRMDALWAYIIWFSLISLVLFGVLELIDRKLVFWREDVRKDVFDQEKIA